VVKYFIVVFVGGAIGAMLREFIMLIVPHLADNFPLDILVANIVATFLLGLFTALHRRQIISDSANLLIGTGMMGGLSTFSSFSYSVFVLMTASMASDAIVAAVYVVISLVLGYITVVLGLKIGSLSAAIDQRF
jgi:fluoride exporter